MDTIVHVLAVIGGWLLISMIVAGTLGFINRDKSKR